MGAWESGARRGPCGLAPPSPRWPLSAQSSLTSTIFVAEVRETPDVAQADEAASHGEHKVDLAGPLLPLRRLPLSLIFWPRAWALPRGRLQDVFVKVFQTLQLLLGGHVLLAFCGGQNRGQRALSKGRPAHLWRISSPAHGLVGSDQPRPVARVLVLSVHCSDNNVIQTPLGDQGPQESELTGSIPQAPAQ